MMKKIFASLVLLLGILAVASASPALPGKFKQLQPDGTVIVLENHGDEYDHWLTDEQGRIVEKCPDGFYRPVGESVASYRARHAKPRPVRPRAWSSYDNPPVTNFGDRKILCIIANFTDSTFTLDNPRLRFSNMLNEEGYSYNGAIGSVRDYYIDNSMGQYRPQFDVYGPVTLSGSSKYYDDNGVYLAIMEAYEQLAAQIPIDDYDTDGDGNIDMVLFYYPGHNQAENADPESIWPHQSTGYFGQMGSKGFVRYFCTSEYRGKSGHEMCGIGTTCHEFAHSLGLPDFYDTDYETNGRNYDTTSYYDLMSSGNYNDSGRRPPYLGALERNMLGWMEAPEVIESSGSYYLQPIETNSAYKSLAKTPGEYFIYECRTAQKWDSYLTPGMVLYQVDQSDRIVVDEMTAAYLWKNTNMINAYGGHPCYTLIPSHDPIEYWQDMVFPGRVNKTSLTPIDWDGNDTGMSISGINYNGSYVSFHVEMDNMRYLTGFVGDASGNPIEHAEVVLSRAAFPFAAAPGLLQSDIVTYTDASGRYELVMGWDEPTDRILSVRCDGFVPAAVNLELTERFNMQDVYLLAVGEGIPATLQRFDSNSNYYYTRLGNLTEVAFGSNYSVEELLAGDLYGSQITSIAFRANASVYDRVYLIVDFGEERVLLRDVTDQYSRVNWCPVDVSDANLIIPEGVDVTIGWGMTGLSGSEYIFINYPTPDNRGGICFTTSLLSYDGWYRVNFGEGYYTELALKVNTEKKVTVAPDSFGISYITLNEGVPELVPAAGKTVKQVTWELDGAAVGSPEALAAAASGTHLYIAEVTYYDGTGESVFYQFTNP